MVTINEPDAPASALFGRGAIVVTSEGVGDPTTLLPSELACAATFGAKRLAEYAAGRTCARTALRLLDIDGDVAIPTATDRRPIWPDRVVGSITHSRDICGSVVARTDSFAALGIDVEHRGRIERELWQKLFVPIELSRLAVLSGADADVMATVLFSAKESLYKCRFTLTQGWLDFTDVMIDAARPDATGSGSFRASVVVSDGFPVLDVLQGRFLVTADTVWTGVGIASNSDGVIVG